MARASNQEGKITRAGQTALKKSSDTLKRAAPMQTVRRELEKQLDEAPYRTLAVAAGLGFVLGGGIFSRATGSIIATGLRLALAAGVTPFIDTIAERIRGGATDASTMS